MADFFASNPFSYLLSWFFAPSIVLALVSGVFSFFVKQKGVTWPIAAWVGLCIFVFAPARYILFILVLSSSFVVQSFSSLFTSVVVSLYFPFVILVLVMVGLGLPAISLAFAQSMLKTPFIGKLLTCISAPILSVLATYVFFSLLPLAAKTVGWLKVDDVIKATNGPAAVVFKYLVAPYQVLTLPRFFEKTPQQDIDLLRSHVAVLYLRKDKISYFVSKQYPKLYEMYESEATGPR